MNPAPGQDPRHEPSRSPASPSHERLAADWPAPPEVREHREAPRFLPDTRTWGTRQWLLTAALATLLALTVVAVAYNPALAERWVEALFGKIGGLVGG